jgi:hypothetical protein
VGPGAPVEAWLAHDHQLPRAGFFFVLDLGSILGERVCIYPNWKAAVADSNGARSSKMGAHPIWQNDLLAFHLGDGSACA